VPHGVTEKATTVAVQSAHAIATVDLVSSNSSDAPFEITFQFQSGSDARGSIHIHRILWSIQHHENGMLRIESASISSLVTGEYMPVVRLVGDQPINLDNGGPIPPNAFFYLSAIFSKDTSRGLSPADFLNRWGGFLFVVEFSLNLNLSTFTKRYDYDWLKQQLIVGDPNYPPPRDGPK